MHPPACLTAIQKACARAFPSAPRNPRSLGANPGKAANVLGHAWRAPASSGAMTRAGGAPGCALERTVKRQGPVVPAVAEEGHAGAPRAVAQQASRDGRDDGVSYEALQDLLRAERRSNKLMPLAPRFWTQVREFLQTVTDAFRLEQARDPFGKPVMRLTDEVKNARHAAEAIWALRERKLAMLALAAAANARQPEGITPDEADLYRRILDDLQSQRAQVFGGLLAHPSPSPNAAAAPPVPTPTPSPPLQVPIQEPGPAAIAPPTPTPVVPADTTGSAPDMVTIRALGDIPPFVAPDMQTYLLKAGDIATVPPSIANLLVRRGKAALVDA